MSLAVSPEHLDWIAVHPNYSKQRLLNAVITYLLLITGSGLAAFIASRYLPSWWWVTLPVVTVILAVWRIAVQPSLARSWRYALTNSELHIAHGRAFKHLSIIPYGRIQIVEVTSGPISRRFGLTSVDVTTASVTSDTTIPGLGDDAAVSLRDTLVELSESHSSAL